MIIHYGTRLWSSNDKSNVKLSHKISKMSNRHSTTKHHEKKKQYAPIEHFKQLICRTFECGYYVGVMPMFFVSVCNI